MEIETNMNKLNINDSNIDPYFNVDWNVTEAKTPKQLLHKSLVIPDYYSTLNNHNTEVKKREFLLLNYQNGFDKTSYLLSLIIDSKREINELKQTNNELRQLNSDLINTIRIYKANDQTEGM